MENFSESFTSSVFVADSVVSPESFKRSIHIASLAILVIAIVFRLIVFLSGSAEYINEASFVLLFGTCLSAQILLRFDKADFATRVFILGISITMFYMATLGNIGRSYSLGGFLILLFLSFVILRGRLWVVVFLIAFGSALVSSYLDYRADPSEATLRLNFITSLLTFCFLISGTLVVGLVYQRINRIMQKLRNMNTELMDANQALERSDAHRGMLMETASDPFILLNELGEIVDVNLRACEFFGFSRNELLSKTVFDIDPTATPKRIEKLFETMAKGTPLNPIRTHPMRSDGVQFPAEISGRALRINDDIVFFMILRDLSERLEREAQLRQQTTRLQLISDNVPIRIAQFDNHLKLTYANKSYLDTIQGDLQDQPNLSEILDPERYERLLSFAQKALSGRQVQFESKHETPAGKRYSINQLIPQFEDGEVVGLFATEVDFTERKKAEAALKENRDLLAMITGNLPARIAYFDTKNQLKFYNKAFKKAYLEHVEIPLQDATKLITKEALEARLPYIEKLHQTHQNVSFELEETLHTGQEVIIQKTYVPHIVDSEIVGRVSLGIDISALRKVQNELQAANDIFNHVMNNIPARIAYVRRDGTIIFVNDIIEEHFGILAGDIIGRNVLDTLPRWYHDSLKPHLSKTFRTQKEVIFEAPLQIADGSTIIERTYLYPHVVNDKAEAIFALHMDVTEIRKTEDSLAKAQKLESLGVLAGGIAHDFNNLLVAMLGQNSLALVKTEETHPARRHIAQAIAASERAASLTQQMLAYSGKGSFAVGPLDMNDLIQNNLNLFAVSIPKNVQLLTDLQENLPTIEADLAQMQQLIMNLIINAGQAIGDKQGRISIRTSMQKINAEDGEFWEITGDELIAGDYVSVEIQDDGYGMDRETMNKIFDPFFTTKDSGTGLGLAAAVGIIRGHNGGIRLYSEVGRGTVFHLLFPVIDGRVRQEAVVPLSAEKPDRQHTILVVDDEESIIDVVSDMLEIHGIKTLRATSGKVGIECYRTCQDEISMVLLDLMMPGMNGEEVFRELRRLNPNVKVILSSGYNEVEATRRFVGQKLADFIQKPYDIDSLVNRVFKAIGIEEQTV